MELLEQEGVRVESAKLYERRSKRSEVRQWRLLFTDANQVVLSMAAYGALAAIRTGVKKARQRMPRASVEIEREAPDDGGFMPDAPEGESWVRADRTGPAEAPDGDEPKQ